MQVADWHYGQVDASLNDGQTSECTGRPRQTAGYAILLTSVQTKARHGSILLVQQWHADVLIAG